MAFNHRKLFSELCPSEFCDPTKNNSGVCPRTCILICPSICYLPFSSVTFPPTPATSSYDETHKPHKLSPLLIITLTLLATTLLIICCYAFYRKYYSRWNSSRRRSQPQPQPQPDDTHDEFHDEDPGPEVEHHIWYINTIGLQPSIISKITVCKYKRGDGLVEGTECSVCLNEFQEDETLRLLPKCNHAFHIPCIDTWLRSHTNCPMCRAGIVANVTGTLSPEPINDILGQGEETHVVISENNREFGREREDGVCELGVGTEEEGELGVENGRKTNENSKEELGNDNHLEVDEVQPMRRSVSMDSLSASMISLALANVLPVQSDGNSNTQLVKVTESNMGIVSKRVGGNQSLLRLMGSSSIGRSLQNGAPISMKRSFSCSAKFLLSRSSRSRNSVLPL